MQCGQVKNVHYNNCEKNFGRHDSISRQINHVNARNIHGYVSSVIKNLNSMLNLKGTKLFV